MDVFLLEEERYMISLQDISVTFKTDKNKVATRIDHKINEKSKGSTIKNKECKKIDRKTR